MSTLDQQTMINSYSRISFYGERRGAEDFRYYTELLANDLQQLGENQGNYESKFIDRVMTIFHRQSNCTSSFIVGPANYNIRRHEKAWDSRDKAYSDFDYWRSRYFKAVNRVRTPSPESEIESAIMDIDKLIKYQLKAKETNKILRKYKVKSDVQIGFEKSDSEKSCVTELMEIWNDEGLINSILKADCFGGRGYASFELTSISTKIRARKQKIENMKSRIEAKKNQKPIFFEGGSIYIENDRVIIAHDSKPEREIIQAIKSNGFRWSPKMGNWCRKHTANARYSANYLLTNTFGGEL